jgi:hypothetical protein
LDLIALAGLAMLAVAAALVLIALAALVPVVLRVRRRALSVRTSAIVLRSLSAGAMARLQAQRAETQALLQPWRRGVRWVRHPLVAATIEWYGRRRARAASARHGSAANGSR